VSVHATDAVAATLHAALDGLSLRQQVIADNVSNLDTPNYIAKTVDFESSLRAAIADGSLQRGAPMSVSTGVAHTPVGANGNNVDLEFETMSAMQANFQYQIASRAISDHYSLIQTAVSGQ
jgi:flagellar basal-body rod protein FlgB